MTCTSTANNSLIVSTVVYDSLYAFYILIGPLAFNSALYIEVPVYIALIYAIYLF